jgi:hypothetical protein
MADWARESESMEEVFSSAYCTPAATSATSPTQGFLISHPAKRCVRLTDADDKELHLYVEELDSDFAQDVDTGALNKRAWVLQERALTRRTIRFTKERIYWECGSVIHSDNLTQIIR